MVLGSCEMEPGLDRGTVGWYWRTVGRGMDLKACGMAWGAVRWAWNVVGHDPLDWELWDSR